jgi:hypothetical protein
VFSVVPDLQRIAGTEEAYICKGSQPHSLTLLLPLLRERERYSIPLLNILILHIIIITLINNGLILLLLPHTSATLSREEAVLYTKSQHFIFHICIYSLIINTIIISIFSATTSKFWSLLKPLLWRGLGRLSTFSFVLSSTIIQSLFTFFA